MKKTITKKLLKKTYKKGNSGMRSVFLLVLLFCLVCVALVPNRAVGGGVAAVVMAVLLFLCPYDANFASTLAPVK